MTRLRRLSRHLCEHRFLVLRTKVVKPVTEGETLIGWCAALFAFSRHVHLHIRHLVLPPLDKQSAASRYEGFHPGGGKEMPQKPGAGAANSTGTR